MAVSSSSEMVACASFREHPAERPSTSQRSPHSAVQRREVPSLDALRLLVTNAPAGRRIFESSLGDRSGRVLTHGVPYQQEHLGLAATQYCHTASASRRHLFSAHDHGLHSNWTTLCVSPSSHVGLSRLTALVAEEQDPPVTQSIATPEPCCPDPHQRSSRSSQSPWVCHTPEPTVLSKLSVPPRLLNFDRYPGAPAYCHRNTAGCWAGIREERDPLTAW